MKSEPVDLVLVNGMGMDASAAGRGCNRNSFEFGDGLFLLASYPRPSYCSSIIDDPIVSPL